MHVGILFNSKLNSLSMYEDFEKDLKRKFCLVFLKKYKGLF